jgi:chemosensory pili system protein ChpC
MNNTALSNQNINPAKVNQIATLLIPVNGRVIMLPNVTVAEIIPYQQLLPEEHRPDWWLGALPWRNRFVPVVSFPLINGEPLTSLPSNRRIAIFNNVIGDDRLEFCGIVTDDLPRLMRVMKDEIIVDQEEIAGPAETARVIVNGEKAAIPNVEFIQEMVLRYL